MFVEVETDDRITGVGECYGIPVSADIATSMVADTFERYVAGADPHHVGTLFRRVYSAGFTQRPDIRSSAISAIMWCRSMGCELHHADVAGE